MFRPTTVFRWHGWKIRTTPEGVEVYNPMSKRWHDAAKIPQDRRLMTYLDNVAIPEIVLDEIEGCRWAGLIS